MEVASVVIKPSPIHGKGVFAAVNFKAGDIILRRDESRLVTEENPLREGEQEYHCDWLADGRVVYLPEPERYINHSCDPNAYLKEIGDKKYHVALRDIAERGEITHDYCIDGFGDTLWECNCGSDKCRKTIHSNFFHLPLEIRIEYLPYLTQAYRERFREQVEELEEKMAHR